MNKNKTDTDFLHILRGMATVSVITHHVGNGNNSFQDIVARGLFTALNVWCVPIFLMITGALFLCVKETINLKKHLERTLHLLGLVLVWNFIYTTVSLVIINKSINGDTLLDSVKRVISGDTTFGYHLWYLYALIGIYLMLPILNKWFTHSKQTEHIIYIVLFGVFSLIIPSLLRIIVVLKISKEFIIWNNYFQYFSGLIVYVLLGAYIYKYQKPIKRMPLLFIDAIVFTLYFLLGLVDIELLNRIIKYDSFSAAILASSIFVGVREFSRKKHIIYRFINLIADYSLSIYLVHVIVIQCLRKVFHLSSESGPLIITLPIITGVTLLISLGISYMGRKIPLLRNILL